MVWGPDSRPGGMETGGYCPVWNHGSSAPPRPLPPHHHILVKTNLGALCTADHEMLLRLSLLLSARMQLGKPAKTKGQCFYSQKKHPLWKTVSP